MSVDTILNLLMSNWLLLLGFGTVGVLAYWYFDEKDEDSGRSDAVVGVGERTDSVLGGLFGVLGALFVVGVSLSITIGTQLAELVVMMLDLAGASPLLAGQIVTSIIASLGLSGLVSMPAGHFIAIALIVIVVTVAIRKRQQRWW